MATTDVSSSDIAIDLGDALSILYPAQDKWFNLGLQLKLEYDALSLIKQNHEKNPCDALREMLNSRIKQGGLTWATIAKALEDRIVGKTEVAKEVRAKYLEPQSPENNKPTVSTSSNSPATTSSPAEKSGATASNSATQSQPSTSKPTKGGEDVDSTPRKRHSTEENGKPNKRPKIGEYYDENIFVNSNSLRKYRCTHCDRIPTICYRCKCTTPKETDKSEGGKGKSKFENNNGLACGNCKRLPCKICRKLEYEPDNTSKDNIRKLKVFCSNKDKGCKEKLPFHDLQKHTELKCLYRQRPCKYSWLGCPQQGEGKELEEHEKEMLEHFGLTIDKLLSMEQRISSLEASNVSQPISRQASAPAPSTSHPPSAPQSSTPLPPDN